MKDQLKYLEKQLESLVEGTLTRILGRSVSPSEVAAQLAQAMDEGLKWDGEGKPIAPDEYALSLNPPSAEQLLDKAPDLPAELGQGLREIARNCGYVLEREPHVTLAADPTLPRWQVRVIAWHTSTPLEYTQAMPREPKSQPGKVPSGAFLIINGCRHFPLDRPVINIGRRLDNQLILDDPHVSRTHAQLRVRDGRFVIFDLGSTAGTRVNNRPVKQHILQPGDVLAVAGVRMVYGEDPGGPPDTTPAYTPPFPPRPAGDQRTRTTDWEQDKPPE